MRIGGWPPYQRSGVSDGRIETVDLPRSPKPVPTGLNGFITADAVHASKAIRFAGLIDEDYNVQLRSTQPMNSPVASAVLRGLLTRNAVKKAMGDPSSLKLFLDSITTDWFMGAARGELADVLRLIERPVDIIVKEKVSHLGMLALQSATGKRLMYDGALLSLGSIKASSAFGRNDDQSVDREWQNEYIRDLEYKIMRRAGLKNRAELYWRDLSGMEELNSLQALAKGKRGLVDGVIVKHGRVVTRANLNAYLAQKKFNKIQTQKFLSNALNIHKIPTLSLEEFSPRSVRPKVSAKTMKKDPASNPFVYRSMREKMESEDKKSKKMASLLGIEKVDDVDNALGSLLLEGFELEGENEQDDGFLKETQGLTFYAKNDDDEVEAMPAAKVSPGTEVRVKKIKPDQLAMSHLSGRRSFLEDDVIYFNDPFVDETARQITQHVRDLDLKKRRENPRSNIKLLLNSPGGSIASGLDIRSTIHHAKNKVDVIVTGMAASCGAFLLASATGNRFATPNARVMIHDAWWARPLEPHHQYNQNMDNLQQMTKTFVEVISKAAKRPFSDVWQDMKIDVWMNPLEAMFYGQRGLFDAILVGGNKAITKQDVSCYLLTELGSKKAVQKYLKDRLASLRVGRLNWKPEEHNEKDPFDNPLKTIEEVARRSAVDIAKIPELTRSVPQAVTDVDQRIVALPYGAEGDDAEEDRLSAQSRQVIRTVREKILGRR